MAYLYSPGLSPYIFTQSMSALFLGLSRMARKDEVVSAFVHGSFGRLSQGNSRVI